jgi:hypothetical protein
VIEEDLEALFTERSVAGRVKLSFPYPFSDAFFELFAEGWFEIKHVLKDMKKRRGKTEFEVQFYFDGFLRNEVIAPVDIIFKLMNLIQREFEMALEKIEYQVEIVTMESSGKPPGGAPYTFTYDRLRRKWIQQKDQLVA